MSAWKAKRFWDAAEAVETDGGFTVVLDGRSVKTPAKVGLGCADLGNGAGDFG